MQFFEQCMIITLEDLALLRVVSVAQCLWNNCTGSTQCHVSCQHGVHSSPAVSLSAYVVSSWCWILTSIIIVTWHIGWENWRLRLAYQCPRKALSAVDLTCLGSISISSPVVTDQSKDARSHLPMCLLFSSESLALD